MKTSASDTKEYRNCIKLALEDESVFNRFKTLPDYSPILEHVSYELGQQYLDSIRNDNPELLEYMDEFKKNDTYGGTNKYYYDGVGEMSPTTLRYVNVLSNFITLGIDLNDKDIVEIGVGYGGQCLVLSKYFKFKSYTLVDLKEPLDLSRKYIDLNDVDGVVCKDMSELKDNVVYDFVISNYAYSECSKEIQDIYYDKIIKNSIKGFMVVNFISDVFNIDSYNKNELLSKINGSHIISEKPISAGNNIVLLWDNSIKISVFTLTYKRYEILEEAIQSFLSQDFKGESEMVIINDHPDVEYVFDHPKIRIVNLKKRLSSIAAKIEYGYKLCKYEYIYRLDDDDLLSPWALTVTKEQIEENPGYEIYRSEHHYGFVNNKYTGLSANVNNGNVYTRKYLDRIKFPDSSFSEDVDITYGNNSKIITVDKGRYTMLYRWGMETYHVSGMGDIGNEEAFKWTDRIVKEETGVITLKPNFMNDYYLMMEKGV